jgi:hypothetical protein
MNGTYLVYRLLISFRSVFLCLLMPLRKSQNMQQVLDIKSMSYSKITLWLSLAATCINYEAL